MMYYVLVIGPYDNCFVGPFTQRDAGQYADSVPPQFDAYVFSKAEMDANITLYGDCPVIGAIALGARQ
jgi:hypothetical protein